MIFSFYSYKGGVGRSQLCANVAAYLCHQKNKRVLLLDWDFEAPGLHYYYYKKEEDLKVAGSLELLERYLALMLTQDKVRTEDYSFFDDSSRVNVLRAKGWKHKTRGCVDLIPAGRYDETYTFRINNFNWHQFYNDLDGQVYVEWLKGQLKALDYDYILIDSRTGINDYSGICNLHLPDANIVVMAANSQNMAGCGRLVRQIIEHPYTQHENNYRTKYILPVLSRINVNNPKFDHWADEFVKHFHYLMQYWETELPDAFSQDIFRDFYLEKTLLEDMPQYSAGENILFTKRGQRIHRSSFAAKFANLADYLENLKEKGQLDLLEQIDRDSWEYYAEQGALRLEEGKKGIERKDVAYAYEQAEDFENSERFGGTIDLYMEEYKELYVAGKYENALVILQKALELGNKGGEVYFEMGKTYQRMKNMDLAIKAHRKALAIEPNNYGAWYNLGNAYLNQEQLDAAIQAYQEAITGKAEFHEAWHNLGSAWYKQRQFDQAVTAYIRTLKVKPDKYEAWYNLGKAYYQQDETSRAVDAYQEALKIKPDFHKAWNNLGIAYYKLEQLEKAIQAYKKAVETKPDAYGAWNNLGVVYYDLKQLDEAVATFLKVLAIEPYNYQAWYNLGELYTHREEYEKATDAYQEAMSANPQDTNSRTQLIKIYQLQNKPQKAKQLLQELITLEPQNPQWQLQLAHFHRQRRNWDAAKAALRQALQIDEKQAVHYLRAQIRANSKSPQPHIELGRLYHVAKKWGKALNSYEKALKIDPSSAEALVLIGNVYSSKGSDHIAIEYYHKSLSIDAQNAYAYYRLGNAYNKIGEYAAAVEQYQNCLDRDPTQMSTLNNLGVVYYKQGKNDLAVETYLRSLTLDRNHETCNNNIGYLYLITGELTKAKTYLQRSIELGLTDFAHRNLGHCYLMEQQPEEALAHYRQSWEAFENKLEFWSGMEDDFQYLKANGVTLEDYETIKAELLVWIGEEHPR
jgi:tetratricopeptide (TPR) repeat protein/MinD-like ATPase involved in chromosome partitioning or flagellar assembly